MPNGWGPTLAERRFVAGILAEYRSDSAAARRLLLEACRERPDWVAPRAYLSVVCSRADDFDGEMEHANRALHRPPATAEDDLFRGYMIGYSDPRRGPVDLDQAIQRSRSGLARVVRAEVKNGVADDSGRVEDAAAAREVLRGVKAIMGDSPMLFKHLPINSLIGCNNCRLHGRDGEARAWLDAAEGDIRASTRAANPDLPQIHALYLLLRDGSADALDAENRAAGLVSGDAASCHAHLAFLIRHDRTAEGLAYESRVRGGQSIPGLRVGLLAGGDPAVTRAEYHWGPAGTVDSPYRPYKTYCACLAGLPEDARREGRIDCHQAVRGIESDVLPPFVRRAVGHAF